MHYPVPSFEQKVCAADELMEKLLTLPRPLVFTNGCFDILHRGHVCYLAQARMLGESLVVAINTDASVKRQRKGNDRPINTQEHRAAVLAALESVSLVVCFDEDTPLNLIEKILPDVLVKGGDWPVDAIVGSQETLARGGSVHAIPFLFTTSTTELLQTIRSSTSL